VIVVKVYCSLAADAVATDEILACAVLLAELVASFLVRMIWFMLADAILPAFVL